MKMNYSGRDLTPRNDDTGEVDYGHRPVAHTCGGNTPPLKYTPELADYILAEVAAGRTLKNICAEDDLGVRHQTVRRWAYDNVHGFGDRFELATLCQADALVEDTMEIADKPSGSMHEVGDKKNQILTRQWYAERRHRRRWGKDGVPETDAGRQVVRTVILVDGDGSREMLGTDDVEGSTIEGAKQLPDGTAPPSGEDGVSGGGEGTVAVPGS